MTQAALIRERTARAQERQQQLLERRQGEIAQGGGMSRHERLLEVSAHCLMIIIIRGWVTARGERPLPDDHHN